MNSITAEQTFFHSNSFALNGQEKPNYQLWIFIQHGNKFSILKVDWVVGLKLLAQTIQLTTNKGMLCIFGGGGVVLHSIVLFVIKFWRFFDEISVHLLCILRHGKNERRQLQLIALFESFGERGRHPLPTHTHSFHFRMEFIFCSRIFGKQ